MKTVASKDGPLVVFDRAGREPALILMGGTLEYRAMDTGTAEPTVRKENNRMKNTASKDTLSALNISTITSRNWATGAAKRSNS